VEGDNEVGEVQNFDSSSLRGILAEGRKSGPGIVICCPRCGPMRRDIDDRDSPVGGVGVGAVTGLRT